MFSLIRNKVLFLIAVIWLVASSILFLLPGTAFSKSSVFSDIEYFDKWVHVGIFFILAALFYLSMKAREQEKTLRLSVWISCLLYGLLIELLQHFFIANRYFDWIDLLADIMGAAVALYVIGRYIKK